MKISLPSISSVLIFLWSTSVFGQTDPNQSVIPPSPVTKEFEKYVTQEVTLYNGIPEINIPLYNIQLKGLTIPITLSYHASGIKYAQESGSAGLGWVLNPGYRVSRSVYGYPDEQYAMPSDMLTIVNNLEQAAINFDQTKKVDRDIYLSKFITNGGPLKYGELDGEFDQFVFSTPSASGEFIITDRTNKVVTTLEDSNLFIEYKTGQSTVCTSTATYTSISGIMGFQITDEHGNKYAFGEYTPQSQCTLETASSSFGFLPTAWGMSEIKTPTGDAVRFTYGKHMAAQPSDQIRNFSVTEAYPGNCSVPTATNEDIFNNHLYETFYPTEIISPNETVTYYYGQGFYQNAVSKIEVKSSSGNVIKTVEFSYRMVWYNNGGMYHKLLDHITISGSDQTGIETYNFEYYDTNIPETFMTDHYGNYLATTDNPIRYYHQEFLDDPTAQNQQTYSMGDLLDCSNSPDRTMNFYMEGLAASREPDQYAVPNYFSLKKITYPTGGFTEYEYENGRYGVLNDVGELVVKNAGVRIKSIKSSDGISPEPLVKSYTYGEDENGYGTAQYSIFKPEFLFVRESIVVVHFFGVHRVINYSSAIQGDVGSVFGQAGFVKYPSVTEYHRYYNNEITPGIGKTVYDFQLGDMYGISPLQHRNIVPREGYRNEVPPGVPTGTPYHINRYRLWDKPLLRQRTTYSYSDGQYAPLQVEDFEYVQQISNTYAGLKTEQSATTGDQVIRYENYSQNFEPLTPSSYILDRYFNYGEYHIEVGKNILRHKTETQYSNGNAITTKYSYDYSNLLISKETIGRSAGDSVVTYTTYPRDYSSSGNFIDDMITNHLLAYPVEQVKYLDDGTTQKIISGKITSYKTGGKGLKDEELLLENSSSLSLNTFKFSNRATGVLPPLGTPTSFSANSQYRSRLHYNSYDTRGNILSTTQDGYTTSYVWGYNDTYPIAKIDNAIYDKTGIDNSSGTTVYSRVNEVLVENFEENDQKIASATSPTGNYVYLGSFNVELRDKIPGNYKLTYWSSSNGSSWTRNEVPITVNSSSTVYTIGNSTTYLNEVRLYPSDAQMTTYTYIPLVGMSSQTDAAGMTTFYKYDPYGRLIQMKDHKGNILKQFVYHYQQK